MSKDPSRYVQDEPQSNVSSKKSIHENIENSNIKYSLTDNQGRQLTKEQQKFFRNSKVRDEDGNLRVVYHGSSEDFTVFDRTKARANMDIQGNFFSPWDLDAQGYGENVRAFYVERPAKSGALFNTYSTILVKASDISLVSEVESSIKGLGYNTYSMESMRESMEESARQVQLMLGGLGAISLFVAAIGITNTMIMSISERTREIGIMKALGCYVRDIRLLFLMEAGAIGLMGGIIGCVISLLLSVIINLFAMGDMGSMDGGITGELILQALMGGEGINRVSVIPLQLMAFAIVFSVFVGLVSGYYPANKAVKIPALEAIKHE